MAEAIGIAQANLEALAENPYPGRGIVQGLNEAGDTALQAYWVMGRSENSQNRILVQEDDIVRTEAFDESKVTDPSLIIYNAMDIVRDNFTRHVVSNGDQTDTITEGLAQGKTFDAALKSREYEPDAPNYTPRISGVIVPYNADNRPDARVADTILSVIRKDPSSDEALRVYSYSILGTRDAGTGKCVHTYLRDGSPLPSFDQDPFEVPLGENVDDTAEALWTHLNEDNRVALVVKGIHLATNEASYRIINAHQE